MRGEKIWAYFERTPRRGEATNVIALQRERQTDAAMPQSIGRIEGNSALSQGYRVVQKRA